MEALKSEVASGLPKLVYIAGYGRSGSTVLSIALGQHKEIFGCGEIITLGHHVWENNEYCSCGSPIHDCEFWRETVALWGKEESPSLVSDYGKLQDQFESLISISRMLRKTLRRESFNTYSRHTLRLLEVVSKRSSRGLVVDSSKHPGRAAALALIPGLDLYVIHLVRDGRGVAWSLLKAYQRDKRIGLQKDIEAKPVMRTAFRWATVNLATESLARRLGPRRFVRIRYEDFTRDPKECLKKIGDLIGADFGDLGDQINAGMPLEPGHQMAGNRLRMNATIELSPDVKWKSQMPGRKQALFTWLCAWLLRRYGYL
ncbi:sulfotransferase [Nordella sp. HKS 07]|uniref:sulfotransferase n=1 Tax=Nordella sp. HKS 07 TaxID=2712222 RepID=UPI0013E19F37|nr:sulfotransferase [Nordella sp. HKS 07]QIG49933.1 sulfotransferase [Nordella sp. HKS 07]